MTALLLDDLVELVRPWVGWRYGALDASAQRIDCSALTASVVHTWLDVKPDRRDPAGLWAHLNIWDRARPWSPLIETARLLEDAVDGGAILDRPNGPGLYLVQGWRGLAYAGTSRESVGPSSRGHAWLWATDAADGLLGWVAESTPPVGVRITRGPARQYAYADALVAHARGELLPAAWLERARSFDEVHCVRLARPAARPIEPEPEPYSTPGAA